MKIVLFGPSGMAGSAIKFYLQSVGFEVKAISRSMFDIVNSNVSDLNFTDIDFVVNAAGMINRRQNVDNFAFEMREVNTHFPLSLANICEQKKIPLVHISTDCVFDGELGQYTEADIASPKDYYGETKSLGEPENAMVLRLSMVGPEQSNFYSLLCWFLSEQGNCEGFTNHLWNGITTLQLASVIAQIITKGLFQPGLFHIFSTDISKYELLTLFKVHFQKQIDINPIDAIVAKDMRLRTIRPNFLEHLEIPSICSQINEMTLHSDYLGHWKK